MPVQMPAVPLSWGGRQTVHEILRHLDKRQRVLVTFPSSFHHSFWTRLSPDARSRGMLNVTGDAKLLDSLSDIGGLSEIADLCEPATKANTRVRVRSPTPQIVLTPASSHARPSRQRESSVKKRKTSSD